MHPTGPHLGPDVLFRESNMKVTLTFNEQRRAAYRQQGLWGDASLADYWQQTARAMPDKIAVVDNHGASYTYSALDHAASCLANWMLAKGIESGDRIAFQLPGWCEFTVIYLACLKIGAVSVPLLPSWREAELVWVLNKCQAKMFFAPTLFKQTRPVDLILPLQNQLPQLQQIVGVDKLAPATSSLSLSQIIADNTPLTTAITTHGDELAAVLFTSGTEGLPKGVMLTHNNILASERAYCARLNLTWQDVFMMPAPLGHATGFLHGVTAPFLIGARSVLLDIFTPDACLALLEQQRCTCMLGATPFVYDLLNLLEKQPADLSALRFFLCGGTTIPKKVARECQQRGIKLLSVYGSTESSPHAVVNLDDPLSRFMHTDGYAAAGVEIKVVDDARKTLPPGCEGEEASRGPNVFMGYFDEPELTARALDEEGWYYSGDLCRMDEAGYIKITGRKKDIIVRGGENISSREVEDILLQHPKIHDACVVAMPDERLGERSCAYVVLKAPHHSLSLEEVVAFFSRKRVAKYKYPEHIVVIEKLPRTASGKIQKFLLRKDIMRRLTQDVCEEIE
ncbi:medium-chain fatty-acid--CoA ligase [Escherichia coli]|jgi:short chain acyl-coA synthetase, anaerobic|uniref:Cyclohexanecarboxylate-CoA ligase n=12 Tax=Enterobacteriaceae TaxID=543 RepID=A0A377CJ62_ECOLX|nr:short chain acyl-CoA synthetase [Escherichia coli O104:H4 str. 2009EL-2050]AFS74235.1 short chain acyl-CoA synthetase [Escherichia coli O104:H4 str. 2011C-3493]AFS86533.1 short chain acyl-CoA synthetase [Escherichia coli O104:H4 str. 2009EL-2071]EAB9359820.1 cyclohexanecarboxylate-CoA ligase [Escherichia coli]EEV2830871.1 medium-chain fatty-acid--CoA ligase [Escherichia coli O91:H21]EEV2838801.1 medium-chain fatty-acid--CoA ligase [Escherichia coli O43:H2]EEY7910644.1 medium-chain fatty-ac